jgi:Transglutaminase-like superfamily.
MKKIVFIALVLLPFISHSQNYNVLLIPDSLLKSADAVLRNEEEKLFIHSPNSATYRHKYAITILKEAGDDYTQYMNRYDKFDALTEVNAKMYDATGRLIKTIKKKDMEDLAYEDRISLMNDARVKQFQFYNKSYPYTVEFEETEEYNGIYALPYWDPVKNFNLSVQQSSFYVETPASYTLHYHALNNQTPSPKIVHNAGTTTYFWEVANLCAFENEILHDELTKYMPEVLLTPSNFEIGGYKGNMDTWANLGNFILQLNKGRDQLPDNVKKEVHALVDNVSSIDEKIKLLYNYMQQNTHYILIIMGMGGWQPFDAGYVAKNKYGDCKALSNYMISLLKEVGINAKYVLINAEQKNIGNHLTFPSPYFNHAIACVPQGKDTTWLECTSQTISTGYLGDFTCDRDALLIDDDGGHVVHTPIYSSKDNLESRTVNATIDEEGNLQANIFTKHTGMQEDDVHDLINYYSKEEQKKKLNKALNLPTYKIDSFYFSEHKSKIPSIDEYLNITSPNYATVSGKRLFIQPNVFNKVSKLSNDRDRKFDVFIKYSYLDIDSINIAIPAGYKVEAMPKDESVNNKFGKYSIQCHVENNIIHLVRVHEQIANRLPASEYNDLVKFYDVMYKADHAKIVFVKQAE